MSIEQATLDKLAKLSQLEFDAESGPAIGEKLDGILQFISQLSEVNTDGVEPMTSTVAATSTPEREDNVRDTDRRDELLTVSPKQEMGFIVVPRVVE